MSSIRSGCIDEMKVTHTELKRSMPDFSPAVIQHLCGRHRPLGSFILRIIYKGVRRVSDHISSEQPDGSKVMNWYSLYNYTLITLQLLCNYTGSRSS
uniref:Uncharacterized protein n=1 Tax=Anguilla anguilla TaxID=7936 RepID=A0A0E9RKE0_ANGAN